MDIYRAILLASLLSPSATQFVQPPTNLLEVQGAAGIKVRYKQVPPGICELNTNVKSFAGYADVATNQHIFWWFFEAKENPKDKPLTVWLNGGPGGSSMAGLTTGVGPCNIGSDLKPYQNPFSWTKVTNMLFIDQPTQVGFSYSDPIPGYLQNNGTIIRLPGNNCPANVTKCGTWSLPDLNFTSQTTPGGAPNFWKTMQGFMGAFPQYSQNNVMLTTVSFGGHYGPVYSEYIMRQNDALDTRKGTPGALKIPLTALSIGNGFHDPLLQLPTYHNFTIQSERGGNTYDLQYFNQTTAQGVYDALYKPDGCIDNLKMCYANGTNEQCNKTGDICYASGRQQYEEMSRRDLYDIRYLSPSPFPPTYFTEYFNTEGVQNAVGAYTNFTSTSATVQNAFLATGDDVRVLSVMDDLRSLVKRGIMVLLYFGDADFISNWVGGEAVAAALGISIPGYESAGYVDIQTSDHIVHGQVKQVRNFAFARVYQSGHSVAFFKPLLALEMLKRISIGVDIATGDMNKRYSFTKGPTRSNFREGNHTVQWSLVPKNATYNTMSNEPNVKIVT